MSTLLEQASLVMIPSGYKEDVVYSQIPTNGNGDLSFTRASNATRVNSAGLVEVVPWNLLGYSEDFTNGVWNKFNISVTANSTTAPNSTTTADTIVPNATNAYHPINQTISVVSGLQYAFSIYAKSAGYDFLLINTSLGSASGNVGPLFNLSSGTLIGSLGGNDYGATITSVGNGWYRIAFSYVVNSTSTTIDCNPLPTSTIATYSGNGTSGLFLWGAQLNIGSTAKPYFPTTDRLNVPRLTYQNGGGGCPSLLLEKQSTNVETWSEDFSNASWTKTNCSITANTTTSPDGTQNADKIIENSVNGVHFTFNVGATLSVAQTLSVYAKADTRTQLALQLGASSVIYNLSSGTIVSGSGGAIVNAGNGWYRCSITTTPANTNALIFTANGGTNSYQGDGTSGLFIWGAQLEAGSYPTSYIPTTSSSATRVADACFKTGISSLIGQTEGTMFVQVTAKYKSADIASINTGATDAVYIVKTSNNYYRAVIYAGGVSVVAITQGTVIETSAKIAVVYKSGSTSLFINGSKIQTDTTTYTFTTALNSFYFQPNYLIGLETNEVQQSCLFPTALTDAECQALTTL